MAVIIGPAGLAKAACFYARLLGIADREFTVRIDRVKSTGLRGSCFPTDDEEPEYKIELDRRNDSIYETLAHEMVHIKQYVTGQLSDLENGGTLWEGVTFPSDDSEDGYWNAPWEIEAFGKQVGMANCYALSCKEDN